METAAGNTDVGRVRKHNEDAFLVRRDLGLFLVADGMGGHRAGDVASTLVTLSMSNFFEATRASEVPDTYRAAVDGGYAPAARRLAAGIRKANRDVHHVSSHNGAHYGMGSTVVAAHFTPGSGKLHVAHVGDSRCYRVRSGDIKQLTNDHSLVAELLAVQPDLTEEELALMPTNIITRALGLEEDVMVDVASHRVEAGDTYVLCSDGLNGMLSDAQIFEAVTLMDTPRQTSELLVLLANEAGGVDNVTAVVMRY